VTRVLVLTALDLEARGLARHLGLSPVPGARVAHFFGGTLELAAVGLRAARLAERAVNWRARDLVVSAGACGALAPALAVGALVVPTVVLGPDGGRWPTASLPRLGADGALLTVGDVVESAAQKARLWMETGALAVDMESAPILAWARGFRRCRARDPGGAGGGGRRRRPGPPAPRGQRGAGARHRAR
jgi:hypothetical protein